MEHGKLIKNLAIWGAVFSIIVGSLWHFVYQWSGNSFVLGLFAPVNESPWEHMKLAFAPLIMFAFVDFYYLRRIVKNYCFSLIKQIGIAILTMLAIYFLQKIITGDSALFADIGSFVLGIALAKYFGYQILIGKYKKFEFVGINKFSAIMLILLTTFFVFATINPPKTVLFLDQNTNNYGIGD